MKKILALLLATILIFTLCACGSTNDGDLSSISGDISSLNGNSSSLTEISSSPNGNASNNASNSFEAPAGYACILSISINPKFDLYLNADEDVLKIQALNDDAKSFENQISLSDNDLEDVIKSILKLSKDKGFLKGDAPTIALDLRDVKNQNVNEEDVLEDASDAVEDVAKELKVKVNVRISFTQYSDSQSSNHTSSGKGEQAEQNHAHSFSKATCEAPATCACGATEGKALGHKWEGATCFQRKTCPVCKKAEGEILPHNYVDGFCTYCKEFESIDPKNIKQNIDYIGYFRLSGDSLLASAIRFEGDACVLVDRTFTSTPNDPEQQPIVFKGKKYYSEGGGMEPYSYKLTEKYVEVTQSFYEESPEGTNIRIHLMKDGRLIVKSSRFIEFPTGTVYSTDINEVL